jgi:hypothetical protein
MSTELISIYLTEYIILNGLGYYLRAPDKNSKNGPSWHKINKSHRKISQIGLLHIFSKSTMQLQIICFSLPFKQMAICI